MIRPWGIIGKIMSKRLLAINLTNDTLISQHVVIDNTYTCNSLTRGLDMRLGVQTGRPHIETSHRRNT